MEIVALDPGGTTGWSRCLPSGQISSGEVHNSDKADGEHHWRLEAFLNYCLNSVRVQKTGPLVIVYERFDNRGATGAEIISTEYIGIIKLFGDKHSTEVTLVPQGVANVKEWLKMDGREYEKLMLTGLWVPGMPHASDANGHMLYYLITKCPTHEASKQYMKIFKEAVRGSE